MRRYLPALISPASLADHTARLRSKDARATFKRRSPDQRRLDHDASWGADSRERNSLSLGRLGD